MKKEAKKELHSLGAPSSPWRQEEEREKKRLKVESEEVLFFPCQVWRGVSAFSSSLSSAAGEPNANARKNGERKNERKNERKKGES